MDNLHIPPTDPGLREYLEALRPVVQNDDKRFLDGLIGQAKNLSSRAQELAWQILSDWRDQGNSPVLDSIWQIDFEREPVSIEQFLEDDYYMGKICNPKDEEQGRLYPVWKEDLKYVCDPRNGIIEWALTGAIGTGKTTAGVLGMIYKGPYLLSEMRDPARFFGLMSKSKIAFGIYATSLSKVSKVDFSDIIEKIDACPYFNEMFPRLKHLTRTIRWPQKNMEMSYGSRELHALGENLYAFLMDEVNFMERLKVASEDDNPDQAYKLFHACRTRIESRYARRGIIPGLMILISSRNTKTDFLEKRLEMIEGRSDVHISDYSPWDVRPTFGSKYYSGKKFVISLGNKWVKPKVLEDEALIPEGVDTMAIPIEHKQAFVDDINQALRDIAGVATFGRNTLIHDPQRVMKCINWARAHPFSSESLEITLDTPGEISDFMDWDSLVKITNSVYRPRIDPGADRTVHVDQATVHDALGLAVGHVQDFILVTREDPLSGEVTNSYHPRIFIDFMVKLVSSDESEIDLTKVITFLLNLKNYGYNLKLVTYDGWQSKIALQQLERLHYNAKVLSVDRTDEAYIALRTAIYEERLDIYDYSPFFDEITSVLHVVKKREGDPMRRGKVDHPINGCFVGETRIPLLDGTCPTIKELSGREAWVYSCRNDGAVVPGRACGRFTKMVHELVDVVLDSGAVARCTPEHLFMLRDGTYKTAKSLRPGVDRLMPLKRQWPVNGGYERVVDRNGKRTLTHHMVETYFNDTLPKDRVVHHRDHDKANNSPENLARMYLPSHARGHTEQRHRTDPEYTARVKAGLQKFNLSEDGRKKHSQAMSRTNEKLRREGKFQERARKACFFRSDITPDRLEAIKDEPDVDNPHAAARVLGCGRNVVMRVLLDMGFKSWDEFAKAKTGENHKVRYVIPVILRDPVPVFDLEVDRWHNFGLSCGIFVHNSKDVSDCVAGVTKNCYEIAAAPAITPEQARALAETVAPAVVDRNAWVLQDYGKGKIIGVR